MTQKQSLAQIEPVKTEPNSANVKPSDVADVIEDRIEGKVQLDRQCFQENMELEKALRLSEMQ